MNADTFKKLAEIVSERGYIIDFDTKKHMIEICAEFDENGEINFDDDQHWTVHVGDKCYTDGEITRAILRKADYIEESSGNGWSFYHRPQCDDDAEPVVEIEDCEMNPRRTKREVLDNFQKWGGSLKIWNGSSWTFGNDADWKHAKFIQLIDADGGGEHWRSPRLSGEDYAHFTLMMAAEMKLKRQTVVLS